MSKIRILCSIIFALTMTLPALAKGIEEKYGPYNVDGGKESCRHDTGDEIKKYQVFEATNDRFFKDFTVTKISGWAPKENSCSITSVEEKEIILKSSDGYDIKVKVPFKYTVYAHADCGSGYGPIGKTISIECEVNAKLVKYSDK